MQIIDGKKISNQILETVKVQVSRLSFVPVFCDVLVGSDPASVQYVNMKKKISESMGIKFYSANFPESITGDELVKEIKLLNQVKNMCGIIVQLPLPAHLNRQAILDSIDPKLDVDCLGSVASEKFYNNKSRIGFPTAVACMVALDILDLNLSEKNIVVVGQGLLVGKPVSALLNFRNLKPVLVTNITENKEEFIKNADIIISGTGQGRFIRGEMIKEGAVLIDAGTSEWDGGIVGDVDLDSVKNVAGYVSPAPGGIGPITVAILLSNILQVAKDSNKNE